MSKGEGTRASWHFEYEKGLVDVLQDHMHQKFRAQNGWKTEGWRSIVQKFNEKFPSTGYTKDQIREKERELKASYRALRDARKNSGAGWNDTLCTINATEAEWETIHKDNQVLKKFRKKGFPLYYNMEKLYEGSIATGDLNFTSTEEARILPTTPEDHSVDDPVITVNPFSTNFERPRQSNDPVNLDEEEHTTSSCSRHKEADGSRKKRKQSQVAGVLQQYVDFRMKQTGTFQDELNIVAKPTDEYSIKNCLAVLESIEELSDVEKAKATKVFKCDQNREIFLNFKNPRVRLLWIQCEIAP
ncbi:hypothetical protein QOZ80_8BG0659650 [Eleusine coracana subsp. coracana]|nr:hypothetical protein QOZ80_8BG0659650 [Eleusine coracana subsp. coracana]